MKVRDNVIIIESFSEAREVAYSPISQEREMGSNRALYAARLAGITNSDTRDHVVEFSSREVEEYFLKMVSEERNHRLCYINFTDGTEEDSSWWGGGAFVRRKDWGDKRPSEYLKVIRHIIQTGFNSFEFNFYDDYDRVTEACRIQNLMERVFVIERIVDPNLFDGLALWVKEEKRKASYDDVEAEASAFIGL